MWWCKIRTLTNSKAPIYIKLWDWLSQVISDKCIIIIKIRSVFFYSTVTLWWQISQTTDDTEDISSYITSLCGFRFTLLTLRLGSKDNLCLNTRVRKIIENGVMPRILLFKGRGHDLVKFYFALTFIKILWGPDCRCHF